VNDRSGDTSCKLLYFVYVTYLPGASRDYVNLLPDPADAESWTTFMPTLEDIGDEAIFAFDGETTSMEVPRRVVDPDTLQETGFTVALWMKHDRQEHDGKQQILCAADAQGICLLIYFIPAVRQLHKNSV